MKPVKLFIVDDHYMVIEGIRSLLQQELVIEWLGHAATAASCLAFLQSHQPDIILMDINLPDKSGIDLCKEVKEKYPSVFIIGLSTFNQESFIGRMMENGASGYVLKNAGREELLEAIEMVMKGKLYLSIDAAQLMRLAKEKPEATLVTRREKEVLELIAEGYTNAEIAERLFVSVSTIDTHRKNLLEKFNVRNTASLVRIAMQQKII
ncbi:MAG: response regulator transcription factor [Chitinophagaceae bacterium]